MSKIPPRHLDGNSSKADKKKPLSPALQLNSDVSPSQKTAAQPAKNSFLPATPVKAPEREDSFSKESPASETSTTSQPPKKSCLRSRDLVIRFFHFCSRPIPLHRALAMAVLIGVLSAFFAWKSGIEEGKSRLLQEQTKETSQASPEFWASMDRALQDMNSGKTASAADTFLELSLQNPGVSSLSYLAALSAFRSGRLEVAREKADESIAKRERVSDSLALLSLIEAQQANNQQIKKFGAPQLRAEFLLRQAARADAFNPLPLIELSANLRQQNRIDEALDLLNSAALRVQPVDTLQFIKVTAALASLQNTRDDNLPDISTPEKDLTAGFSAAYVSLRKGDPEKAAQILHLIRQETEPRLFRYLINDQALRKYSGDSKLQEFFH